MPVIVLIAYLSVVIVACRPTPTPVVYSDILTVAERETFVVQIAAQAQNRIVGSISVLPLNAWYPIKFVVQDPFGNMILDAGEVEGERSFAVIAAVSGKYRLLFDNSVSPTEKKTVRYSVTVHQR